MTYWSFGKLLAAGLGGLLLLYLALPLGVVVVRAIDAGLIEQLRQSTVAPALRLSLITTPLSTLVTIALGTPLAYRRARSQRRGHLDWRIACIFAGAADHHAWPRQPSDVVNMVEAE